MRLMRFGNWQEARLARWVARGISLVIGLSLLLLIVFNEDFRQDPTLPTVILWLMALSLLIAWKWERMGGLLALLLSPVLLVSLFVMWSGLIGLITPVWQLFMIALAFLLPFLIAAWLYLSAAQYSAAQYSAAQYTEMAITAVEGQESDLAEGGSSRTTLIILLLGLAALILYFVPLFIPVQQQLEPQPVSGAPIGLEQIIDQLRSQGAVVGVGSIPAEHPLFSVSGRELNVNGEVVLAFEYTDTAAATADAAAIDRGDAPAWDTTDWPAGAQFYQVNNILLLYEGSNDELTAILEAAFGPPFAAV